MKKLLSIFVLLALLLSSMGIFVNAEEHSPSRASGTVVSSHGLLPFEDIDPSSWYVEGLTFCYSNGIITGDGNLYTFNPDGKLTRATFAVMLARAIGATLPETPSGIFADCDNVTGSWYIKSVEWAALNGYMIGTSDTTFSPDEVLTREQLVTVFMRFMKRMEYDVNVPENILDSYIDKDAISDWAVEGVKFAVAAGLISSTSTSAKVASPGTPVNREQAVKIFMSFLRTYYYGDCQHQFSTATCTEASVCGKCGLVDKMPNGHLCTSLTCTKSDVCLTCGQTVLSEFGPHSYADATCTAPRTCTRCGDTRGYALGHKYSAATCTSLAECSRCGETTGNLKDHNFKNSVCTACGFDVFQFTAHNLETADGYSFDTYISSGEYFEYAIWYDAEEDQICIVLWHTYPSGQYDAVMFSLDRSGNEAQFDYEYYTSEYAEYPLFDGYGIFNPNKFKEDAWLVFSDYEGNSSDAVTALDNIRLLGDSMMVLTGRILEEHIPKVTLPMLGFHNYS